MTQQEQELLAEMLAEPVFPHDVKAASNFIGSMPYTHLSLLAMATVCSKEFQNEEMAQLLLDAAEKMAAIEATVI